MQRRKNKKEPASEQNWISQENTAVESIARPCSAHPELARAECGCFELEIGADRAASARLGA